MLAAGASTRLGEPKQCLLYNGKSLLHHAIDTAKESKAGKVIVVLGANGKELEESIINLEVNIYQNSEWEEGMGASIRNGLKELIRLVPETEGVIFMACDQPFVSPELINQIVEQHRLTGKPVIASSYGNSMGIPAFFHKSMFPDLLSLEGDTGAKKIMLNNPGLLATVNWAAANIDVDTKADYEALKKYPGFSPG